MRGDTREIEDEELGAGRGRGLYRRNGTPQDGRTLGTPTTRTGFHEGIQKSVASCAVPSHQVHTADPVPMVQIKWRNGPIIPRCGYGRSIDDEVSLDWVRRVMQISALARGEQVGSR